MMMNTTEWRYTVMFRERLAPHPRFERFELLASAEDRADELRAAGWLDITVEPARIDTHSYARIGSHLRTGYGHQPRGAHLCAIAADGITPCEAVSARWASGHCAQRPSTRRPSKRWEGCFDAEAPATARDSMNRATGYVAAEG